MQSEIVARGIPFAEGPVWCPDGTVVVTSVAAGALFRVQPEQRIVERFAETRGGANGAALAADGSVLVTQNGGIDFTVLPGVFSTFPPCVPTQPGLQLATPDGTVSYLLDDGFRGPNDLAITAAGDVYFTDPGHYPPQEDGRGRVMVLAPERPRHDVRRRLLLLQRHRVRARRHRSSWSNGAGCNASSPTDHASGSSRSWARVAATASASMPTGASTSRRRSSTASAWSIPTAPIVDFLPIAGQGLTTNCCFGGHDLRTLFVADALPGDLVAFEGMPTPGLALPTWPGLATR